MRFPHVAVRPLRKAAWFGWVALVAALAACSGGGSSTFVPPIGGVNGIGIFDRATSACSVSYDGFIWYQVPGSSFSPIDVRQSRCSLNALAADPSPPIPNWARSTGSTQTLFVATSLQEAYSPAGMQLLESLAAARHVPMTWLIRNSQYLFNSNLYNAYHSANGDDVEAALDGNLIAQMRSLFPWYVPTVSAEGAGRERNPTLASAQFGEYGFWGITWNSHGTDGTFDLGAPWGTYCADPASYKRPAPDGSCSLVGVEWTARDLTRAYLSGHEEYFSTDPDDMLLRAGFSVAGGAQYGRALVDAYAAAGQSGPLVMVVQEESAESTAVGNDIILAAMYDQAVTDNMRLVTMAQAAGLSRTFAATPRAVAFPFIPGGTALPSAIAGGGTLYPATIDYHDTKAGMTFLSGHTLPSRVFRYADYPVSTFTQALPQLSADQFPSLTMATFSSGSIALQFTSPVALRFGVALWADPASLGISGTGVVPAGRAGVVLTFDLQPGTNSVVFACAGCASSTLPYST